MKRVLDTAKPDRRPQLRQAAKQTRFLYRMLTGQLRLVPDFIIIGAQRCGTTSLYNYLIEHPGVAPALTKEVNFFDRNFRKGTRWYGAHFPSLASRYYATQIRGRRFSTGESSPYYIFHPLVPCRIAEMIPAVKLIVLLRNPVDRAYSHYRHVERLGFETLSFEDALAHETERLRGEREKIVEDDDYNSFNHQHYSYLSRGIYVDQLETWASYFPREQLLVLRSEDLYADPETVLMRTLEFLELPNWQPKKYWKYNFGNNPTMDAGTRRRLLDYFKPHNERVYEQLGTNFGWDE